MKRAERIALSSELPDNTIEFQIFRFSLEEQKFDELRYHADIWTKDTISVAVLFGYIVVLCRHTRYHPLPVKVSRRFSS